MCPGCLENNSIFTDQYLPWPLKKAKESCSFLQIFLLAVAGRVMAAAAATRTTAAVVVVPMPEQAATAVWKLRSLLSRLRPIPMELADKNILKIKPIRFCWAVAVGPATPMNYWVVPAVPAVAWLFYWLIRWKPTTSGFWLMARTCLGEQNETMVKVVAVPAVRWCCKLAPSRGI